MNPGSTKPESDPTGPSLREYEGSRLWQPFNRRARTFIDKCGVCCDLMEEEECEN